MFIQCILYYLTYILTFKWWNQTFTPGHTRVSYPHMLYVLYSVAAMIYTTITCDILKCNMYYGLNLYALTNYEVNMRI